MKYPSALSPIIGVALSLKREGSRRWYLLSQKAYESVQLMGVYVMIGHTIHLLHYRCICYFLDFVLPQCVMHDLVIFIDLVAKKGKSIKLSLHKLDVYVLIGSPSLQHTLRVNGEIPDVNDATQDHKRLSER
ncbi:hypothetical protein RchiOBHm_Chr2g0159911 [Rosa chinensis]|uniref:Uncharacterized protein n=1 Tax=Rosa chinensis TaxID=74649 RepID=A0A2P6S2C5_ROSCH|nr:hypothetical protein RchiOBHm_Chr2g0159911 [Rosa chinensis]